MAIKKESIYIEYFFCDSHLLKYIYFFKYLRHYHFLYDVQCLVSWLPEMDIGKKLGDNQQNILQQKYSCMRFWLIKENTKLNEYPDHGDMRFFLDQMFCRGAQKLNIYCDL